MQHYTTAPPAAATGLDLFAAAWLERFTSLGGSLMVLPDGSANMFLKVNASDVRGYEPPPPDLPQDVRDRRGWFDEGMFTGRTRELMDLLHMVPGGNEAVKAHVRAFPTEAYRDGHRIFK